METEGLEFTVEDILQCHRGWITDLYINEEKTEVEIVELLHERRLFVTLAQICRCVREWNLVRLSTAEPPISSPSPTLSDDWELVSSPPKPEAIPRYTPSDPALVFEYNKKLLPSIPIPKSGQISTKIQKRRPSSTTDRLKLTCHHGPASSDAHEVQARLESIPDGTSPIDRFTKDPQTHERIALGLDETNDEHEDMAGITLRPWRRAIDANPNTSVMRHRIGLRTIDRKPKYVKNERNGSVPESKSHGKRKRSLSWDDEDEERMDRKKTPPSPPDEE